MLAARVTRSPVCTSSSCQMRGWCAWVLLAALLTLNASERLLSRKKRYLVFPDGSSFVLTMSNPHVIFPYKPPVRWQAIIECDVSYKLPNSTRKPNKKKKTPGSFYLHRRDRRELYQQLETLLDSQGLDGVACVKRAVCEASKMIPSEMSSFTHDVFRLIFTVPPGDEGDMDHYDRAADMFECGVWSEQCPFSLLDFQLSHIWD